MSEVEVYQPAQTLPARIQYAKALADSGLLPRDYRGKPANVLWAMEYGDMLGLSPMAAITGVHVIEGKPTASAGLISALVRRAGHKLRVHGDTRKATCQIVRADDPDYTFEVTFSMEDAKTAGLTGKDVWRKYGASMLKARAITQCARDACEEALYGLHYTPEELGAEVDEEGNLVGVVVAEDQTSQQAPASEPVIIEYGPDGTLVADMAESDDPADRQWHADMAEIGTFATDEDGQRLWRAVYARQQAGLISPGTGKRLQNKIKARWAELKAAADAEAKEGTVVAPLDPADEWAQRVEEIASEADAEVLTEEVAKADIDPDKAASVHAAIAARLESLGSVAA